MSTPWYDTGIWRAVIMAWQSMHEYGMALYDMAGWTNPKNITDKPWQSRRPKQTRTTTLHVSAV